MFREWRIGTSENVSTPPAKTTLAVPDKILSAPEHTARELEIHACEIVCAGTFGDKLQLIADSRAKFACFYFLHHCSYCYQVYLVFNCV